MRILLVTHYYAPENGAPQRRWRAMIERFVAAGHEVWVLAPPPHYPHSVVPRSVTRQHPPGRRELGESGETVVRVRWLPHRGGILGRTVDHAWAALDSVLAARRLARSAAFSPEVVIASAPAMESLLAGQVLQRLLRVPLVVEMRDAWPDLLSYTPGLARGTGPAAMAKRVVHRAVTRMQRSAGAVVTTTERFATVLRTRGIDDVVVIRNGTEPERYGRVAQRPIEAQGLRVLYMGTIGRSQGLSVVVAAAAIARGRGLPVEVRIVGDGADVVRLQRMNAELGDPVELVPAVAANEVAAHYDWTDSIIVSLRDWEPFEWTVPSKLYEALATGKHISGLLAGEAAGIVDQTSAGFVSPPGDAEALVDAWSRLLHDRASLDIGAGGRAWLSSNATYDLLAERYVEVLARVVGSEAAAPAETTQARLLRDDDA